MEFRVLGRLVVRVDDRELPLGGPLRRAVLAALLLEPDRTVSTERLVRVMYAEELPPTAVEQVRQAVYHLRKALPPAAGGHRIVTEKPGYRLRLGPGDVVDLDQFDAGVTRARTARAEGDLAAAADGFRAALTWWRGDALADLADLPVSSLGIAVNQRRLVAVDERIEVDLALGRHVDLLPELSDRQSASMIADRVADDRVALHRLPGLEPLAVVALPSTEIKAMFFDEAGRLVTWVGRDLLWWDPATGAQLRSLGLLGLVQPGSRVSFLPMDAPDLMAVFVTGQPDVTIVDTRNGQVVDTVPVGPDVAWVSLQGPRMLVYRDDRSVEVWNTGTRLREFGPLPVGGAYNREVGFLTTPGRFVVADSSMGVGTELRFFDAGRPDAVSVVDLGEADPIAGISGDGTVVAQRGYVGGKEEHTGILRLTPAVWRAQLCDALDGRRFTAEERATLPASPEGPECR